MQGITADNKKNRVNSDIDVSQVQLIGAEGENMGVVETSREMELAMESDLDLVEIVPHADPPVCRLMNFGKFLFDLNKKKHAAKKKQKQVQVKEIKFRPSTDESKKASR